MCEQPVSPPATTMRLWTIVLTLAWGALSNPTTIGNARYVAPLFFPQPPTYQLREPAITLVATDAGLVAAKFYPYPPLRVVDPTDDIACKYIPRGNLAILYIPVSYLPSFRKHEIYKSLVQENANPLENHGNSPLIIYLNTVDLPVVPKGFRKIFIQSDEPNLYRMPAYAPEVPLPEVDEVPPEGFAPPPVFSTLCVSPEKPKPTPVLYYPVDPQWVSVLGPSVNLQDLTPQQISKQPNNILSYKNYRF